MGAVGATDTWWRICGGFCCDGLIRLTVPRRKPVGEVGLRFVVMAEIWPRLKRRFICDARRRKTISKAKKADAQGSPRLVKLTALLEGMHGKKTSSSGGRSGTSASATCSSSRSALEPARTAGLHSGSKEGSKSPELVVLHYAVRPSDAQTRSSEYTESFSIAEAGFNRRFVEVEKSQPQSESVCEPEAPVVGNLHRDLGNSSEDRQSLSDNLMEEASPSATPSVTLPVRTGRCMRIRSKQTPDSSFVVLVALGAFISKRFAKAGNSLATVLTFNAVVRTWRGSKLYARLMFSSVAFHFLDTLRPYFLYCPRRLCFLPSKLKVIADTESHLSTDKVSRNSDVDVEGRGSSLGISVLPLEPAPSAAIKQGAPLALLITVPESSATPTEAPTSAALVPIPATVLYKESGASSPTRRLAKKFTSRFKKLKIFRSSSPSQPSSSESSSSSNHSRTYFTGSFDPGSPISPSSLTATSSPDRHRKCPFSRPLHRSKPDIPSEFAESEEASVREKKSTGKKSRFSRTSSTETIDIGEITVSTRDTTPTSRPPAAEAATTASRDVPWRAVGLLVTLLFLIVGRVPAIMATSLFILVVSNAQHDRSHRRIRGRETRASEAARKLHRSPPPRRHPGSPQRRY